MGNFQTCDWGQLKSRYSGPIGILASGPSAAVLPNGILDSMPFFVVKGAIKKYSGAERTRPFLYIHDQIDADRLLLPQAILGCELSERVALPPEAFEVIREHYVPSRQDVPVYTFQRANRVEGQDRLSDRLYAWRNRKNPEIRCDFSLLRMKKNRVGFSKNISLGIFCARTIVYHAIQMAAHCGFNRIYLFGFDLNPSAGYFYPAEERSKRFTLDDHFTSRILPAFKFMSKKIVNSRFEIYNVSPQSRMPHEVCPKITYDQFFESLSK
jgi:hypothetical protein